MRVIKIKQEKQSNGIWGTPMNCVGVDVPPIGNERKYLIFSAWICAINETFNKPFMFRNFCSYDQVIVYIFDDFGFIQRSYHLSYNRYEVIDDTLYEFESQKEHINFLRKHKIKKLNEY
jgi:hypothetical protein